MPRVYKRKIGSRRYLTTYTPETIDKALKEVKSGKPIRKTAEKYKIPYATLRKYNEKGLPKKKHGGQTCLTPETERALVQTLSVLADWRVPLDKMDIRFLVKTYLDRKNVTEARFKDNMPGEDWVITFMKRHNLTKRVADNVRISRALVNEDVINAFFDNLEAELHGISPECIFNYDETNVTDDPGAKTVIVKRGHGRRVERKQEHSKQAISIMFSGNATGKLYPPMVVYKAKNLYTGWTKGGPPGSCYAVSKNGWFDGTTFQQWYFNVFLPEAIKLQGTKVLIGDNLGSHFSPEVIQSTVENDIKFITLPPNATHLCQPLDVAVFRSLKQSWREILQGWRKESRSKGSIPKEQFPTLLSRLMNTLKAQNLISGFSATGIFPLDRHQVLKRLPGANKELVEEGDNEVLNASVLTLLKENVGLGVEPGKQQKRKRGQKCEPGKRILGLHNENSATPDEELAGPSSREEENKDDQWQCISCDGYWEKDSDDVWIVCDMCDDPYHLQCCGIHYDTDDYYHMDIESIQFSCRACFQDSSSEE